MMKVPITISRADQARLDVIIEAKNKAVDEFRNDVINGQSVLALPKDLTTQTITVLFDLHELKWDNFKHWALLEIDYVYKVAYKKHTNSATRDNLLLIYGRLKQELEAFARQNKLTTVGDTLC